MLPLGTNVWTLGAYNLDIYFLSIPVHEEKTYFVDLWSFYSPFTFPISLMIYPYLNRIFPCVVYNFHPRLSDSDLLSKMEDVNFLCSCN